MLQKPTLSYRQIWNINFGFLGTEICFTMVIANTSRILSILGAQESQLALLWLVAPLSGLFMQPIIGYLSDRTWTRLGRRIPYILIGLLVSAGMMLFMPNSAVLSNLMPPVVAGVVILFLMQSAFNVSMQPYRSLVADMVNHEQSSQGYSVQTLISNMGSIIGACLPFVLAYIGLSNLATDGGVAPSLMWAFYIGTAFLIVANLWTSFTVKEYPPHQFEAYAKSEKAKLGNAPANTSHTKKEATATLLRIALVQLFAWIGFYYLWVFGTNALAENIWNTNDPHSAAYNDAGNWFGIIAGTYNLVAAIFSIFIARITTRFGRKKIYALSLMLSSSGFVLMYFAHNQYLAILPMILVGTGWAMTLTMPFSILSKVVPSDKMGWYMGLLNITIVIPQITGGLLGKFLFTHVAGEQAAGMFLVSAASLFIAGLSVSILKKE